MNAHNPAAERFQITNVPMAAPACCAVCGAVDRPVLDFGMSLEFHGAVLFCVECLANAARLIGYAPVAEINDLREKAKAVIISYDEVENHLNKKVAEIGDIVAGLSRDISGILSSVSVDDSAKQWQEPGTGVEDSAGNVTKSELDFESGVEPA